MASAGEARESWAGANKSKWGKGKAATERAAMGGGGKIDFGNDRGPRGGKGYNQEGQWNTAQTTYGGAASSITLETANAKSYEIFIK